MLIITGLPCVEDRKKCIFCILPLSSPSPSPHCVYINLIIGSTKKRPCGEGFVFSALRTQKPALMSSILLGLQGSHGWEMRTHFKHTGIMWGLLQTPHFCPKLHPTLVCPSWLLLSFISYFPSISSTVISSLELYLDSPSSSPFSQPHIPGPGSVLSSPHCSTSLLVDLLRSAWTHTYSHTRVIFCKGRFFLPLTGSKILNKWQSCTV